MNSQRALVLHLDDIVAVAITPLVEGETITITDSRRVQTVQVRQPIPIGHKVALCALARGQYVVKYGQPIGVATQEIAAGEHVHVHNLASDRA